MLPKIHQEWQRRTSKESIIDQCGSMEVEMV
jgi:hypothetical protein